MTVIVTGGAGFVGRALVRALDERGENVVVVDRALPETPFASSRVTCHALDITRPGALDGLLAAEDGVTLVHAAAVVGVAASLGGGLAATVQVNVAGSVNLFESVLRAGTVRRVVDLSSEETYGDFSADPIGEDAPARPLSPYGITKFAVERLGNHYADTAGLPYATARMCWVYGPDFPRSRLPAPWLDDAVAGRTSVLASGGDQRIDFTHVDDVVRGILLLVDAPRLRHRAYNIATGHAVTIRDLARTLHRLRPAWSVELGGGALEQAPGVRAAHKGALDISRARDELGYQPSVTLDDGLERTLASLTPPAEPPPAAHPADNARAAHRAPTP